MPQRHGAPAGFSTCRRSRAHIKLSYGTGFRAPSLFERFGVHLFGYVGNPNLKPEQSQGWETGFTTDLAAAGRSDFATAGATYFDQRVRNLIEGVFSPVDTDINLGSAHVHGVESEVIEQNRFGLAQASL